MESPVPNEGRISHYLVSLNKRIDEKAQPERHAQQNTEAKHLLLMGASHINVSSTFRCQRLNKPNSIVR